MISIALRGLVEIYWRYRGTSFHGLKDTTEDGKLIVKRVLKKWDVGLFSGEQFCVKQSLELSFCSFTKYLVRVVFLDIHSFIIHSFIHSVACLPTGP